MDRKLFDSAAGLALFDGNQAIYTSLLRSVITYHQDFASHLDLLIQKEVRQDLVRFCHTLKSTSGQVGSPIVYQQAKALEQKLKSGTGSLIPEELSELDLLAQNMLGLVDMIQAYLTDQERSKPTEIKSESSGSGIRSQDWLQLRSSLDEHDPITSRRLLIQLEEKTRQEAEKRTLSQVQAFFSEYQYGKACQIIDLLLEKQPDQL